MGTQVHLLVTVVVLSFMVTPAPIATAAWAGGVIVYYGLTSAGHPEHTGAAPAVPACPGALCGLSASLALRPQYRPANRHHLNFIGLPEIFRFSYAAILHV